VTITYHKDQREKRKTKRKTSKVYLSMAFAKTHMKSERVISSLYTSDERNASGSHPVISKGVEGKKKTVLQKLFYGFVTFARERERERLTAQIPLRPS
jgi:hypothetical protein